MTKTKTKQTSTKLSTGNKATQSSSLAIWGLAGLLGLALVTQTEAEPASTVPPKEILGERNCLGFKDIWIYNSDKSQYEPLTIIFPWPDDGVFEIYNYGLKFSSYNELTTKLKQLIVHNESNELQNQILDSAIKTVEQIITPVHVQCLKAKDVFDQYFNVINCGDHIELYEKTTGHHVFSDQFYSPRLEDIKLKLQTRINKNFISKRDEIGIDKFTKILSYEVLKCPKLEKKTFEQNFGLKVYKDQLELSYLDSSITVIGHTYDPRTNSIEIGYKGSTYLPVYDFLVQKLQLSASTKLFQQVGIWNVTKAIEEKIRSYYESLEPNLAIN